MKAQILFAMVATIMTVSFAQAEQSQVNMNDPNSNPSIPKEQPKLGGGSCPFAKASVGEFSDVQKLAKENTATAATSSTEVRK